MFLLPQIESASILTKIIISSLLCYNDIRMSEIHQLFQGRACTKFEITKCCGDLEHKVKVIKI